MPNAIDPSVAEDVTDAERRTAQRGCGTWKQAHPCTALKVRCDGYGILFSLNDSPEQSYEWSFTLPRCAWRVAIVVRRTRCVQAMRDIVSCAAVAEDGSFVVTASDDKTARIWELDTGACAGVLPHIAPLTVSCQLGCPTYQPDPKSDLAFASASCHEPDRCSTVAARGWCCHRTVSCCWQ